MARWAIGDIHGHNAELRQLLAILGLLPKDEVFFLGDFIDRGPDSRGVLDTVFALSQQGVVVRAIKGNHEDILLSCVPGQPVSNVFASREEAEGAFICNGGMSTLMSFGADAPEDIPQRYLNFMAELPLYLVVRGFVIVHAGLNFDLFDPLNSSQEDMLWLRDYRFEAGRLPGRLITGHTITPISEIFESGMSQHVKLDNGVVSNRGNEYGRLVAFNLDDGRFETQERF